MEFSPANKIVQLCLQGMQHEETGRASEAETVYQVAWNQSANDFEKYLSAYFLARVQNNLKEKLSWLEKALTYARKIEDDTVKSAYPNLYFNIAECYRKLGATDKAEFNSELANSFSAKPSDTGPFYHGTRANLKAGDFLTAGFNSNYHQDLRMNHIYFTALVNGAGLAAALAAGDDRERVYIVEPTGSFENDPNVTDKKFPGNPTRSYRTKEPLKIIGELTEWVKQTPEQIQAWKEKLKNNKGEIIN